MVSVHKREGESSNSLIYRFNKRTRQSGLIKECRRRRFVTRKTSKTALRESAVHREEQKESFLLKKKLGLK